MSRTVKLTLEANVSGLVSGLKTAQKATSDFSRDLGSWRAKNEQHLDALGGAAGKAGLAITAGLGLIGKAAMDWQSDWTGVLKTTDEADAKFYGLEEGLRGLAKTLPTTHREIAGVAEAAGQLGVGAEDIVDFTRVMIDLGESTNLGAEEAATSLARFSNVMGTSTKDVGRLGATLVGLGNNYATTESEIMAMSMRLAGAGKQIGLSEGQTMGLAAAMSSVGIEAEAGGSAMSLTMKRIGKAVDEGGSSLDTFASVSGMTAEQFATAWKNDAAGGLEAFVLGLGNAGASGESVNAILTELGVTGIRESDALLRLSSAGELMGSSMKAGADEYADGSALIEEATKRYETAESKVKIAWNNIKDAAITAGSVMLPIIANIADGVSGLADWFGSIPGPIQGFVVAVGSIVGTGALALAGIITLAKKTGELQTAFAAIAPEGGRAAKGIGAVSKAMSGAIVVGFALSAGKSIIEGINDAARSGYPDLQEYFNLLSTGGGKDVVDALDFGSRKGLGAEQLDMYKSTLGDVTTEAAAAKRAIEYIGMAKLPGMAWVSENLGLFSVRDMTTDAGKLETAMGSLGRAFAMGEVDMAQQGFADMATQLSLTDEEVGVLINKVPELKKALTEVATDGGIQIDPNNELSLVDLALGRIKVSAPEAADAVTKVGSADGDASGSLEGTEASIRGVAMSAEDAEDAVKNFYDALVAIGAVTLTERDALRGYEEAIDAAAEAATKNGKTLDRNTEKGRANEASLDAIAAKTLSVVTAQEQNGRSAGELAATMEAGREAFIKQAKAMGMGGDAANRLADEMNLIPDAVFMQFETNAEGVTARVSELYEWIKAAPDGKIQIDDNSPEVRATLEALGFKIKELPNGKIEVSEKGTKETGDKIDKTAKKKREATITAKAITDAANAALNNAARDRDSTIRTRVVTTKETYETTGRGGSGGLTRASGGSVFGQGTETSDSIPAWLSNNEHVLSAKEVRGLGGHSAVERLRAMARGGDAPRFATGGRVGWSQGQDAREKRQYEAAKREVAAAKKAAASAKKSKSKGDDKRAEQRLKRAEKELSAAKDEYNDSRERTKRLKESAFDLRRDNKRGSITEAFTSGGGMAVVDRMFEASNNKDLSKKQRGRLRSLAYKTESDLLRLEKRAASVEKAMGKAVDKRDDLLSARNGARDSITGTFNMGGLLGQKDAYGYDKPVNKKGLLAYGKSLAAGSKTLSQKVKELQKRGFNESMINQVIDEWTNGGTFELANAMLAMNKGERSSFNKSFKDLGTYGTRTGNSLTEAMAKGGLNAAQTLVNTLAKQEKSVDRAFYNLGKAGQKGFNRAWGIASPAKEAAKGAGFIVDGYVGGLDKNKPRLDTAMAGLMGAPSVPEMALSVPPSREVARYAAQPAAAGVVIDYDRLAQAMTNVQLNANLQIDRKQAGTLVQAGQKFNGNH